MKKLIVVDMQNDFITGSLGTKEAERIVSDVCKKIQHYQQNGWAILYTRDTHGENYLSTAEGKKLPVEHCIYGTKGWAIADGLETEGSTYIDKKTFGFMKWDEFGITEEDELELVGLCTDICVVSNAIILKAMFPEIPITVDASCCAGVTPESHKAALTTMKMCQIQVVNETKAPKEFCAAEVKNRIVEWIRGWFEENGKGCNAVLGISGGKDSSVAAALCVEALGKERVFGVLMPNGEQSDIDCSLDLVRHLDIAYTMINIKDSYDGIMNAMQDAGIDITSQTAINLSPRLRMSALYAVSQSKNGRVVNTCNLSEDWVGYSTRYGDAAGDFSPLSDLTVTEVKEIGRELGLPEHLIEKVPSDGLSGKTDEDNLGFTYAVLDQYIREGICEDEAIKEKIDKRHAANLFKLQFMPVFRQ